MEDLIQKKEKKQKVVSMDYCHSYYRVGRFCLLEILFCVGSWCEIGRVELYCL